MSLLSPAPPRAVLREQVADILRDAILDGRLPLGSPLIEVQVARQLGTSRAPLREALRQLEQEGLVTTVQHRGSAVVTLADADLEEIFSLRATLECFAVRRVFERGDVEALISTLAQRVDKIASCLQMGDLAKAQEEDFRLHESIIRASLHSRLMHSWETMKGQIRLAFRAFHQHPEYPGFANLVERHQAILAALTERDVSKAEATIQDHILGPGNSLMWLMRMRSPASSTQQGASLSAVLAPAMEMRTPPSRL